MSRVMQKTREAQEKSGQVVGEHPLPSALTAFGAGVGIGLLAALLLPDAAWKRDTRITTRVLDSLSDVIPDSVARRMP